MATWTKDGFSTSKAGMYNGSNHGSGYATATLPAYGCQRPIPMPRTKRKGKSASILGRRSPLAVPTTPIVEEESPRSLTPPPDFVTDPDEEKRRSAKHPLSTKGSNEFFGDPMMVIPNAHYDDTEASVNPTSLQLEEVASMDPVYPENLSEPNVPVLGSSWTFVAGDQRFTPPFPLQQTKPEKLSHSFGSNALPSTSPSTERRPVPKPRKITPSSSEPQLARRSTPLHNPHSKKKLEEMLETADALAVNAPDLVGQTPLHCLVRKGNVDYVIILLSMGESVDINAEDNEGNTPLHVAVMEKKRHCINILLAFGASVKKTNRSNHTPVDLARGDVKEFLVQFISKVERQDFDAIEEFNSVESFIDPYTLANARMDSLLHPQKMAAFVGCWEDQLNQASDAMQSLVNFDEIVSVDKQRREIRRWRETNPVHIKPGIRVLFLDGGGIRGLVQLMILMEMERITGKKITELFDWFIGTSVGAIISLSLLYGKSQTLKGVRSVLMKMKSKIFGGILSLDKSTRALEQLMKEEFPGDIRLSDQIESKVMVCVVNKSSTPPTVKFFNNFMDDEPELTEAPLWYACRATSAAPMYFQSCGEYVDGGVMANNPSMAAWTEIQQYYLKRNERPPHISIAVSIGSGAYPDKHLGDVDIFGKNFLKIKQTLTSVKNLISLLQNALGQSEETSRMFSVHCKQHNIPFFRFNPALIEVISPGETNDEKLIDMLLQTRLYLQDQDTQEELLRMVTLMRHLAQIQPSRAES